MRYFALMLNFHNISVSYISPNFIKISYVCAVIWLMSWLFVPFIQPLWLIKQLANSYLLPSERFYQAKKHYFRPMPLVIQVLVSIFQCIMNLGIRIDFNFYAVSHPQAVYHIPLPAY